MAKIKVNELTQQTPQLNDTLLASGENNEYACKIDDLKNLIAPSGEALKNIKDAENGGIIEGLVEGEQGQVNVASGMYAHVEGGETITNPETGETVVSFINQATGKASHAEGRRTTASGDYSHAEGFGPTASGFTSHAEGGGTTASGVNSHAEGDSTTASGNDSHAEGNNAKASGGNSHAEGVYTIANHSSQHVFGEFNVEDPSTNAADYRGTYVEIVGNGTTNRNRSNARTLDWSGNEWLAGSISPDGGVILKSPNGTAFKLTVSDDGTLSATNANA